VTGQLHCLSSLRAAGYSYDDVRVLLRGGSLTPVRRGAYLSGRWPDDLLARHRLAVRAAVRELGADAVVSHASAAVLHGLPIWLIPLDRVHVTKNRSSGGRRAPRVHVHVAALGPADVIDNAGIRVTSVARTIVDVARSVSFEKGVVVADAALSRGLVDGSDLADSLHRMRRRGGVPLARRVIAFADARSESVGESRSRVAIARAGLPPPTLQWEVRDEDGRLIGRVDFGWPEQRVIGEFDGRMKYGRQPDPDVTEGEAVYREKRREDELRAERLAVVRWGWEDLDGFEAVARRLRRGMEGA
jgi:predicted transcriptional regulator of viral defense system